MRWSEEPTWSLQRARILIPLLPFTFHFPTRHRAVETRALLIPSLLLTFDLSPATARAKPALWFVLRIDCEVDLHAGL